MALAPKRKGGFRRTGDAIATDHPLTVELLQIRFQFWDDPIAGRGLIQQQPYHGLQTELIQAGVVSEPRQEATLKSRATKLMPWTQLASGLRAVASCNSLRRDPCR
jgi:hypothetical protein